jgi:hypothetical protein
MRKASFVDLAEGTDGTCLITTADDKFVETKKSNAAAAAARIACLTAPSLMQVRDSILSLLYHVC